MLYHLGAAYYESLEGRAAASDVSRAVDAVKEHLRERPASLPGEPAAERSRWPSPHVPAQAPGEDGHLADRHRWAYRVRDVMTADVITVDRATPHKEIARLLTGHQISGMPVLTAEGRVAGVVTEADLLALDDRPSRAARTSATPLLRRRRRGRAPLAGDLMTSPAVTVHPQTTIPGAARMMTIRQVRRLPVVDDDGTLVGIVSRRDLISVFLRPDSQIAQDARAVIDEILRADPAKTRVLVRDGVVTLAGTLTQAEARHPVLVAVAIRLLWDIDGVIDVINRLDE